jgi:hypothetical protein
VNEESKVSIAIAALTTLSTIVNSEELKSTPEKSHKLKI